MKNLSCYIKSQLLNCYEKISQLRKISTVKLLQKKSQLLICYEKYQLLRTFSNVKLYENY